MADKKKSNTVAWIFISIALAMAVLAFTVLLKKPKITEFEPDYSSKGLSWTVRLLFWKVSGKEILNKSFKDYEKKMINGSLVKVFWESPDNIAVIVIKGGEIVDKKSVNFTSKSVS